MEHPFLSTTDLATMSIDELQTKISELTGKLNFAYQMGNLDLQRQVKMALDSYTKARNKKLDDMYKKGDGDDHSDKINISWL